MHWCIAQVRSSNGTDSLISCWVPFQHFHAKMMDFMNVTSPIILIVESLLTFGASWPQGQTTKIQCVRQVYIPTRPGFSTSEAWLKFTVKLYPSKERIIGMLGWNWDGWLSFGIHPNLLPSQTPTIHYYRFVWHINSSEPKRILWMNITASTVTGEIAANQILRFCLEIESMSHW